MEFSLKFFYLHHIFIMRSISILGLVIITLLPVLDTQAQIKNAKTTAVKIFGNTPAVKITIEKEGNDGKSANVDWNQTTKLATITYDPSKTDEDAVLKRIALAGFDNEKFLAPDDVYAKLPKEEQYARTLKPISRHQTDEHTSHVHDTQIKRTEGVSSTFTPLANNYFGLKDALVKTDSQGAAAKAITLLEAIKAVDMNKLAHAEHVVWMKVMNNLMTEASTIAKSKDIAKQRVALVSLSKAMYELLKVAPLDTPVYYQHCPMYDEGKGAHWLSKEEAVKNPFFGSQMISCGSTVETLN